MDIEASIEQVAGILVREELSFQTRGDGRGYRLLFGSGTGVLIEFDHWKNDVIVKVSSPILSQIDPDGPGAAAALNALHELNHSHCFLKFVFVEGALVVACDLLGGHLHSSQLLNAVYAVASAARRLEDELIDEVGGLTYQAVMEEWVHDIEDE
jgi:hypothetical protein